MATYNNEVYKAWTPTYRDSKNADTTSEESGLRFQSGLKQQVTEREEELKKDLTPKVRSAKELYCDYVSLCRLAT